MLVEVCANSVQSAINAQRGGADRIELCCDLPSGGLSPSSASILVAREKLDIELFVFIRPRIGDFCYNALEFEIMKREIEFAKDSGADGIVFGILQSNGKVDFFRTRELVELAHPLPCTFHRAFDMCPYPFDALDDLVAAGITRVLTSGGKPTALEGKKLIAQLNKVGGGHIGVIAGAGINEMNVDELVKFTNVNEIHLSGKTTIKGTFHARINGVSFGNDHWETSARSIYQVKNILDNREK